MGLVVVSRLGKVGLGSVFLGPDMMCYVGLLRFGNYVWGGEEKVVE